MIYEVKSWSLAGAASRNEEGKFIQNTNIKVGLQNGPEHLTIDDGCSVDITGKIIDSDILTFIEQECENYVNQKYNQQP